MATRLESLFFNPTPLEKLICPKVSNVLPSSQNVLLEVLFWSQDVLLQVLIRSRDVGMCMGEWYPSGEEKGVQKKRFAIFHECCFVRNAQNFGSAINGTFTI